MRKLLAIAIASALCLLSSCGQPQVSPLVETDPSGKYFNCTIDDFIVILNAQMEDSDLDEVCFSVGPDSGGRYNIEKTTYMKFRTNSDGKMKDISLYFSYRTNATVADALAAGALMGLVPKLFGVGDINLME